MQSDPDKPQPENVPPLLPASEPPVIRVPPPPLPPPTSPGGKSPPWRKWVAILASVFLGLFIVDGFMALADDSLILLFGVHVLSIIRGLVFTLMLLMAVLIYLLMALTPMIPKRLFLPLTLFIPASVLVVIPFTIYSFDKLQQVGWAVSLCEVILGLGILYWAGGFKWKWRWPLVTEEQLGSRGFSWGNLAGFVLANIFLLLPAVVIYCLVCAASAVGHFSEGFMAVHPGGITVQVRKYARADGKTIELYPMSHIADADFYQNVSKSFSTNSVVLLEGVTDKKHLLTNGITYKRMATALGLSEQHENFKPTHGHMVRADVDVDEFSPMTIQMLNLVMLLHSKGFKIETLSKLMEFPQTPQAEQQLMDDLIRKRNKHLEAEIDTWLPRSETIIVPWGAAHMPEIAKEIQKSGFKLTGSQDYLVIRFHSGSKEIPK